MRIKIINGPNLNLLGQREKDIYGTTSFDDYFIKLKQDFPDHELTYFQSNVEGDLINQLHESATAVDCIIFNPGGYSHTSVSLADAIAAIDIPVLEVHISNLYQREEYRHVSITGGKCVGVITGLGLDGYRLAIIYFTTLKT